MKSELAAKKLERYLMDSPDDVSAHFELGSIYSEDDNNKGAIAEFEKVLLLSPRHFEAMFELGLVHSKSGQYEAAVRQWQLMTDEDGDLILEHIKTISPSKISRVVMMWDRYRESNSATSIRDFSLGFANMILGRWDRAIFDFKAAIDANRSYKLASFYKGICNFQKGLYPQAAADFNMELENFPRHAQCIYHLGITYLEMGRHAQAVQQFHRAINEMPRYIKAHYQLGRTFAEQGNPDRAAETLEKAISFKPDFPYAYFELGVIAEKQYQLEKAAEYYKKALQLKLDFIQAGLKLGLVYRNMGKTDLALEYLENALELESGDPEVLYYIGLIYLQREEYDNAIERFIESLKISGNQPCGFYYLGLAYFKSGRLKDAIEHYKKSIALSPGDVQVYNALGMAYFKSADLENAIDCFNKVLAVNSSDSFAQYILGIIYFSRKNYVKATSYLQKVANTNLSSIQDHFTGAILMIRNHEIDQAISEFLDAALETSFTDSNLNLYATIEQLAIIAIEKAEQEAAVNPQLDEFRSRASSMALLFANLADERIPGSSRHSKRVSDMAGIIAREFKFSEAKIDDIKLAGLIHDVGKILIDQNILTKSDLNPEEEQILRQHPQKGYDVVKDIPGMEKLAKLILYHHENYDGKGYPAGLRGEEIPISSQIIAIADCWDSMVHRDRISPATALDRILSMRFKRFSSSIINAFLAVVDKLS